MEKKINIEEILKDCPEGMELDCVMCYNVTFKRILDGNYYPIQIQTPEGDMQLNQYGCMSFSRHAKCIIFPKGKTTWEGFVTSCKFKDGDVISDSLGTCIFKGEGRKAGTVDYYCAVHADYFMVKDNRRDPDGHYGDIVDYRLATEEEKTKLFNAIKDNGYKWNAETKTLEKLVEPRFKVGDRVKAIYNGCQYDIKELTDTHYTLVEVEYKFKYTEPIIEDKHWELVPNKFDLTTLKPFESRVLVRDSSVGIWLPEFFACVCDNHDCPYMIIGGARWKCCIPFEGNEHLMCKTDDCDEYYKTWEK